MERMSIFKRIKDQPLLAISLLTYHLFVIAVAFLNFPLGKWFLGWDSVNPEFNFLLNLQRGIFGSWQENYGVGLMGGHGFAATLPHTIIAFIFSLLMPVEAVRPFFTLFMWYLGGLGVFFLVMDLLKNGLREINQHDLLQKLTSKLPIVSLFSSLYYLINLATVEIFSIQLEAFVLHFAFLPWLFWISIKILLARKSKKLLFLFFIINFFASGQAFIPSLFVAYLFSLSIFMGTYLVLHKCKLEVLKKTTFIFLVTLVINAYWLLPFTHYTVTRGGETGASYNNLISTPEMKDKSQKYGDLKNAALVNGFYWEAYELGDYVESQWRDHHQFWLVPAIGYFVFILAVIGLLFSWLVFTNKLYISLGFVFLYLFANLAISVFPFDYLLDLLNSFFPVFGQAFRTTFTKIGLGVGFSLSIFFGICLFYVLLFFQKKMRYAKNFLSILLLLILFFSLIFYAKPLFKGGFFFNKMMIDLPDAYLEVMEFFQDKPDGRIADFPQNCADGWYGYNWNYFGSGFYWYGIKQPFMSRSFDVWSKHNENYFWQLNQALIREDFDLVEKIFASYDIRWVLYDPNMVSCRDKESVFGNQDLVDYLKNKSNYKLVTSFDSGVVEKIEIYERQNNSDGFVNFVNNPVNVGPTYDWSDLDQMNSPYISNQKKPYDLFFPFRNALNKRGDDFLENHITEDERKIFISSLLPKNLVGYTLTVPSVVKENGYYPVRIELTRKEENIFDVLLSIEKPSIYLDGLVLTKEQQPHFLGEVELFEQDGHEVFFNDRVSFGVNYIYYGSLSKNLRNEISIVSKEGKELFNWKEEDVFMETYAQNLEAELVKLPEYGSGELKVSFSKNLGIYSSDSSQINNLVGAVPRSCAISSIGSGQNQFEIFENLYTRMISINNGQCLSFSVPEISTNDSYLVKINSRNISGQQLKFKILNNNNSTGVDLFFQADDHFTDKYIVLPPTFRNELGYDFVFENKSSSFNSSVNDLGKVQIWSFPYQLISQLMLASPNLEEDGPVLISPNYSFSHPNPAFYVIGMPFPSEGSHLVLNQSFAPEWLAFTSQQSFPYFELLENHHPFNNWANAWELPEQADDGSFAQQTIYLFFWPQALQFIGFGLLVGAFVILSILAFSKEK